MRGNDVLGVVFANADDSVLSEITGVRSMASVPFAGGYRLIDFVLSNMVNAGMTKVGIITNNNYQSLMDHIGGGKPWDLNRKTEGLYLLPPFNAEAINNYNSSRIGALKNIMQFLQKSTEEYVLISDCTYVNNFDLSELFDAHEKSGADISLMYMEGEIPQMPNQLVISETDENDRITKMAISDGSKKKGKYSVKTTLMKKSLLERLINEAYAKGNNSFERDIFLKNMKKLRINSVKITGFCRVVDSLKSYFDANFDLLKPENYKQLFCTERPVYTKVYEDMPAVYGLGSDVKNSLIADGCIINGEVENCVLFRNCCIEKDAVVKNSIIMPHGFIAENALVNFCVTDKNVTVRSGKNISGADSYPIYIGKGIHI